MKPARSTKVLLFAVGLTCMLGGYLHAQNQSDDDLADPAVTLPMEEMAELSPAEMDANADKLTKEMQKALAKLVQLGKLARDTKDVIKLNCVNDKILQVKQLVKIAEAARTNLTQAIAVSDDDSRYHEYGKIVIAAQQVRVLLGEGEECIGEELVFVGPTEVDVDEPDFPDDPFDPGFDGIDIEPPGYASPFA